LKRTIIISVCSLLLSTVLLCCAPLVLAGETLIGVVMTGDTPYYAEMHKAFVDTLKSSIPSGEKIEIILQRPFPDPIALSNAARKLIAADVDLIVSYGSPATLAVIQEKSKIPHVYAGAYDPEAAKIAGARMTGCGYKVPLSSFLRHLKSLKEIATLTVLYSGLEEDSVRQVDELRRLAGEQGIGLQKINITKYGDIGGIGAQLTGDAVFITGSAVVNAWLDDILKIVKEKKVLSASILPDQNEAGVVLTLYLNPHDLGAKAAEMVARIRRGEQPEAIGSVIFRHTELVFNVREAKELGVKPSINLIAEATKVIK